jgi:Phage-related protein
MNQQDKPLVWLHGEVRTPPFSQNARIKAGVFLRRLQQGENLEMPHSRPMPGIGNNCHELRIPDSPNNWRIIYRIDRDAILIVDIFPKTTTTTPIMVIKTSKNRLNQYDRDQL